VDAGALQALARHVGQDKLRLGPEGLSKADPAVRMDLSAVAKGYAVDRVAEALQELGAVDLLVEVGGELTARGGRPGGEPWRVGIERPVSGGRSIERVLPLRDRGLATSGDYRNFYEKDGKRLSHLIDPRSGRPVEHGLASVSVVHPRVAVADAWATALSVLGPRQGPRVAEAQGLSALFIVRLPDGGFKTDVTPAFAAAFPE
jgi:thiamine biosynthesis lipoprotein